MFATGYGLPVAAVAAKRKFVRLATRNQHAFAQRVQGV
jgi:hypothetical protein